MACGSAKHQQRAAGNGNARAAPIAHSKAAPHSGQAESAATQEASAAAVVMVKWGESRNKAKTWREV